MEVPPHVHEAHMHEVIALILGGGMGTRLYPLTADRSKPAVPFAGNYRIIDIPISNCIHSGINQIFVLTQFNSVSLNRHIAQTYNFDIFHNGFVEILAAEENRENIEKGFSHGTAEAVRDALNHLKAYRNARYILILAGDQLYQMDFRALVHTHISRKADVTLGVLEIPLQEASRYGLCKINEKGLVKDFSEKPEKPEAWSFFKDNNDKKCHASMNMYLFNRDVLESILFGHKNMKDFGSELIPHIVKENKLYSYVHKGYWEDIGTLKSFHAANIALTQKIPPLNIYDTDFLFFSKPRFLPPSKINSANITSSILSDGVILENCHIDRSVIGVRSMIRSGTHIANSVIMGNDYYENFEEQKLSRQNGLPLLGIGSNCVIKNAIIDKNCRIGNNVRILNENRKPNGDHSFYSIRDGIIIIPKYSVINDNSVI